MLYDPKWEQQTKADPFKIETLIAWLEKQPAEETYCYMSTGHCLLAQYFVSLGFQDATVGGRGELSYLDGGELKHATWPECFGDVAYGDGFGRRTFGAALGLAREIAAANQ